jgi:tetratricopeptide (TPR) repeat protein
MEGMMPQTISVFGQVESDLKRKKYSSAMMKLGSISVQYSKDIIFLNYLAQTQKALMDTAGLIRTLREIIKTQSTAGCQLELMQILYTEGSINEALDIGLAFQESDLSPKETKVLSHLLLKIFIEENDFEGVVETIAKFETLIPHDDFMQWALGLVALARFDKNAALEHFRNSLQINNNNDQAWVSLAMLHDEMGDRELALANVEMSLDHNPLNQAAVKLYSNWAAKDSDRVGTALKRIQFYLSEHEFDEEVSLCHIQVLTQIQLWRNVDFEINKLILNQPMNPNFHDMKKNLELNINL